MNCTAGTGFMENAARERRTTNADALAQSVSSRPIQLIHVHLALRENAMYFKSCTSFYSLLLTLTLLTPQINSVGQPDAGSPIPIACKYGSGKCADVKPVHQAPSTDKNGPQDPTVDPDCGHYGNCRGGNPEGNSASAKRQTEPGTGSTTSVGSSSSGKHK